MGQPKSNHLTPRDLEIAAAAWKCFKSEPTIDYAKLAEVAGFKNAASASACWNTTKKKLFAQGSGTTEGTNTGSPATPKTPASRKRKTASAKMSTGEDGMDGTPTKKGKKQDVGVDDDDEQLIDTEESPVKKEPKEDEYLSSDRKDSFFD